MKSINLGKKPIMFGNSDCPACLAQFKLLNDHYTSMGKSRGINYYDLKTNAPPTYLLKPDGTYSMPTWYIPPGPNKTTGTLKPVLIKNSKNFDKLTKRIQKGKNEIWNSRSVKNVEQFMNFGLIQTPAIGVLEKYGKNFPNGKGMHVGKSFINKIEDKWGKGNNSLVSGTLGREFGPGNVDKIYTNKYFNNIRMARPGGDLDTVLRTNSLAYINTRKFSRKAVPGMIYDSPNPQFVGFNNLPGKRTKIGTKFGTNTRLYYQMGPPYGRSGSDYLIKKGAIKALYGGGVQFPLKRPKKVQNKKIYIGKMKAYNPLARNIMNR